ncbi:hypothetical protein Mlaev_02662 [Microbacterium laevaniformans]|uniref:Uncharacterized protein n=2 Tax=Microbacterium laevaniformans TaxID=36807 RepID=A0A150H5V3_9MICO|nr:hypothetical protein Mlaev_02662 [Microbacterium laevaniformans]
MLRRRRRGAREAAPAGRDQRCSDDVHDHECDAEQAHQRDQADRGAPDLRDRGDVRHRRRHGDDRQDAADQRRRARFDDRHRADLSRPGAEEAQSGQTVVASARRQTCRGRPQRRDRHREQHERQCAEHAVDDLHLPGDARVGEEHADAAADDQQQRGRDAESDDRPHQRGAALPRRAREHHGEADGAGDARAAPPVATVAEPWMRPSVMCSVREQRAETPGSWVTTTSLRPCPVVASSNAVSTSAEVSV